MVEQPRPGDLLLVAAAECLAPLARGVPAALALDDVLHLDSGENVEQLVVRNAPYVVATSGSPGETMWKLG